MWRQGYSQTISFFDRNTKHLFFREIIYPADDMSKNIYNYFSESINNISTLCIGEVKNSYYQISENKIEKESMTHIEHYWLDGVTYLIEYLDNNKVSFLTVSFDTEFTMSEVKNLIAPLVGENPISFFDKLNDCWIKKTH